MLGEAGGEKSLTAAGERLGSASAALGGLCQLNCRRAAPPAGGPAGTTTIQVPHSDWPLLGSAEAVLSRPAAHGGGGWRLLARRWQVPRVCRRRRRRQTPGRLLVPQLCFPALLSWLNSHQQMSSSPAAPVTSHDCPHDPPRLVATKPLPPAGSEPHPPSSRRRRAAATPAICVACHHTAAPPAAAERQQQPLLLHQTITNMVASGAAPKIKLVGHANFVRANPKSDKFEVRKFHHIEFWCADATNTFKRCGVGRRHGAAGVKRASGSSEQRRRRRSARTAGVLLPQVPARPGHDADRQERPQHRQQQVRELLPAQQRAAVFVHRPLLAQGVRRGRQQQRAAAGLRPGRRVRVPHEPRPRRARSG